jgi:hypothetical protein
MSKEEVVARRGIRAVRRVIQQFLVEMLQHCSSVSICMRLCLIYEDNCFFAMMPNILTLCSGESFQCLVSNVPQWLLKNKVVTDIFVVDPIPFGGLHGICVAVYFFYISSILSYYMTLKITQVVFYLRWLLKFDFIYLMV